MSKICGDQSLSGESSEAVQAVTAESRARGRSIDGVRARRCESQAAGSPGRSPTDGEAGAEDSDMAGRRQSLCRKKLMSATRERRRSVSRSRSPRYLEARSKQGKTERQKWDLDSILDLRWLGGLSNQPSRVEHLAEVNKWTEGIGLKNAGILDCLCLKSFFLFFISDWIWWKKKS